MIKLGCDLNKNTVNQDMFKIHVGVSLNGGTSKAPQNDHF